MVLLLLLPGSCAGGGAGGNAVVVERDSPAVGKDGRLVEDVGLETFGGVFTPLLKAGCATPCGDAELFSTAQDNQTRIEVSLFRGRGEKVSQTHPLADCYVADIPPAPRGVPQIEVTVEAAEKEIRLSAFDNATKRPVPVRCDARAAR